MAGSSRQWPSYNAASGSSHGGSPPQAFASPAQHFDATFDGAGAMGSHGPKKKTRVRKPASCTNCRTKVRQFDEGPEHAIDGARRNSDAIEWRLAAPVSRDQWSVNGSQEVSR